MTDQSYTSAYENTQLTQGQRYQIYALLKTAHSQTEIVTVISVHLSICDDDRETHPFEKFV